MSRKRKSEPLADGKIFDPGANTVVKHNPRLYKQQNQGFAASLMTDYELNSIFQHVSQWQYWGSNNQFPAEVMALIERNPIMGGLIEKITDFVMGQKFYLKNERIENGEVIETQVSNPQIEDWMEESDYREQKRACTKDYLTFGNFGEQVLHTVLGDGIAGFVHTDTNLWRVGEWKTRALNYKLADWQGDGIIRETLIPYYARTNEAISFYHCKAYRPGAFRYGAPFWIGAEFFVRLMNEIPVFHLAGIRNGYGLRWHIKIPKRYFEENYNETERLKAEQAKRDEMNEFLSGAENHGKAFISRYTTDAMGKEVGGIVFDALKPEIFDSAFSVIFDQSMIAVCSAMGINPELAGVILQGKMSGNSGSGIRNAHNQFLNLTVPNLRAQIFKDFEIAKRANGWPADIKLGFVDFKLEKLDDEPAATSPLMQ